MNRGAATYRATAITAALLGALCLPCVLGPWLLAAGLSSVLLAIGMWFTPALLGMIGIGAAGSLSRDEGIGTRCRCCWRWRPALRPTPRAMSCIAGR